MKYLSTVLFSLILSVAFAQQPATYRIAYADIGYIVSRLPEFKDALAQYQDAEKKFNDQLKQKSDSFRLEYQQYVSNVVNMSDTARADAEQRLQTTQSSVRNFQAEMQQSLDNYQKLLLGPLYLSVNAAVKQVAAANGYALVLTAKVGNGNVALYHDPSVDISDLVIKSMSASTAAKPANKAPAKKK